MTWSLGSGLPDWIEATSMTAILGRSARLPGMVVGSGWGEGLSDQLTCCQVREAVVGSPNKALPGGCSRCA
jgi:hypothetical protein